MTDTVRHVCRACGSTATGDRYLARELAFGLGGHFSYSACRDCGSLSLVDVPELDSFYPDSYYSLDGDPPIPSSLRFWADRAAFRAPAVSRVPTRVGLLRRYGVKDTDAVLDVGSGGGAFLYRLSALGFRHLLGVDPHVASATDTGVVRLLRGELEMVDGRFDTIMFNHSLEHVADPVDVLRSARDRLSRHGRILVRVPTIGWAWRRYGTAWSQLDAPRHLTIFTEGGLLAAVTQADLVLDAMQYVSTDFQMWGSRAYEQGRTLVEAMTERATIRPPLRFLYRLPDMVRAWSLNRRGDGDEILAVLSSPDDPTPT